MIERIPRYFDKETDIGRYVNSKIRQLMYDTDKNEPAEDD